MPELLIIDVILLTKFISIFIHSGREGFGFRERLSPTFISPFSFLLSHFKQLPTDVGALTSLLPEEMFCSLVFHVALSAA